MFDWKQLNLVRRKEGTIEIRFWLLRSYIAFSNFGTSFLVGGSSYSGAGWRCTVSSYSVPSIISSSSSLSSPTYSPLRTVRPPVPPSSRLTRLVLPLLLRLVTQVQFATPLSLHPAKPLRFFLAIWAVFNTSFILVHLRAAGGTKGDNWSGRGVVLDFIGQGTLPLLHSI